MTIHSWTRESRFLALWRERYRLAISYGFSQADAREHASTEARRLTRASGIAQEAHRLADLYPEAEGRVLDAATERIADARSSSEDAATDARIDELRGN
jgi:hypothetical protein